MPKKTYKPNPKKERFFTVLDKEAAATDSEPLTQAVLAERFGIDRGVAGRWKKEWEARDEK